jgi:S-formylglutathione hydrolase FrmB
VLELEFESKLLGGKVHNLVFVPKGFSARSQRRYPTVYFLHDRVLDASSARGGIEAMTFAKLVSKQRFILVVPDTGTAAWCGACDWVDGRDGKGVPAESYLLAELLPAVESALPVRKDRGGRGISGAGMGGTGALVQGWRHPDVFGLVGAIAPALDLTIGSARSATFLADLATQGYGTVADDEVALRNINPLEVANHVISANVESVVAVPAGCLKCLGDDTAALVSAAQDRGVSGQWTERGVPHSFVVYDDGQSAADVWARFLLPRANKRFAKPVEDPFDFAYASSESYFSVWDYRFTVARPNRELLRVLAARLDGTRFTLAGTGAVQVTSPAKFHPHRRYRVTTVADPQVGDPTPLRRQPQYTPVVKTVLADAAGRLHFPVALRPSRSLDERKALVDEGHFPLPHVRVRIDPEGSVSTSVRVLGGPGAITRRVGAEFSSWKVAVKPVKGNAQVLQVLFDSKTLKQRVSNFVYLPDAYVQSSGLLPVDYHLHGTGYGEQTLNVAFEKLAGAIAYVVVVPDIANPSGYPWCNNCYWVDTREQQADEVPNVPPKAFGEPGPGCAAGCKPADAETFLYKELIPLTEAMFRVRTDRAGRALTGNSMGATGAFIQAFRHPDRFAYVGGISGALDASDNVHDPFYGGSQWFSYLEFQGYPQTTTAEALYRNVSALHLGPGTIGTHLEAVMSLGDGCATGEGHCASPTSPDDLEMAANELVGVRFDEHVVAKWTEMGVPHSFPRFQGMHYWPDGDSYRSYHLTRIQETFAEPSPLPRWFSYKTVDKAFSIWGYDLRVARPNDEFFNLVGARTDGTDFILGGTGEVTVRTPAAFEAGRRYVITVTPDGRSLETRTVRADRAGRIEIELTLGPTRAVDERVQAVATGLQPIPKTRVEVARA